MKAPVSREKPRGVKTHWASILAVAPLFMIIVVSACSRQESQRDLIQKVALADRVIVLNSDNGLTKTLKGEELKKIVRALEISVPIAPEGLSASPGYTLVFFRGGVHLATVPTAGVTFWFNGKPHEDKSGAIQSLSALGLQ